MREMPGYCCTLSKCRVPKKEWVTLPPCDVCEKAMDVAAAVLADQATEAQEKQRAKPMGERLRDLMESEGLVEPMLRALCQRAAEGDLKAVQYVLELLGERPGEDPEPVVRVMMDPDVQEYAK